MIPIIYFGTEQFAAEILTALINCGKFKIKLVVTQPDRPTGRQQIIQKSPVKQVAEKYNIDIAQPANKEELEKVMSNKIFSKPSEIENLKLNIICQYGLIIPANIIDAPKMGSLNIHPSLLPKYRGASPIQSAIINGESKTGVTIMVMDEKMDHGNILAQQELPIMPNDTFPTLHDKLLEIAKSLIVETAQKWIKQSITSIAQNHDNATFCKMLTRENGHIDWNKSAQEIYNLYRGLQPWPGIWTTANGQRIKLLKIALSKKTSKIGEVCFEDNKMFVGTPSGSIEIIELQPEGKNPMPAIVWKNGYNNISKFE